MLHSARKQKLLQYSAICMLGGRPAAHRRLARMSQNHLEVQAQVWSSDPGCTPLARCCFPPCLSPMEPKMEMMIMKICILKRSISSLWGCLSSLDKFWVMGWLLVEGFPNVHSTLLSPCFAPSHEDVSCLCRYLWTLTFHILADSCVTPKTSPVALLNDILRSFQVLV